MEEQTALTKSPPQEEVTSPQQEVTSYHSETIKAITSCANCKKKT